MSNIRLFFPKSLSLNLTATLDKSQSHYVSKVMRIKENEVFSLFNISGEWEAKILGISKNIVEFTYDLSKFKQFKPKKFDWINPELHGNKSDVRGFVAQEIETVDSTLVGNYELYDETLTDKNPDLAIIEADDGTNIAKDSKLGTNDAMYISVIQQMLTKIETLEVKVAALEAA